jgi:integrase
VLSRYLAERGIPDIERIVINKIHARDLLIPNLVHPGQPLGYTPFYQPVKRGLKNAIQFSELTAIEKHTALKASLHWLRHTFGTRAKERGVSDNVLMAQFGHADLRPTAKFRRRSVSRSRTNWGGRLGDVLSRLAAANGSA